MNNECYSCHNRTIEKLIGKFQPEESVAEEFEFIVRKMLLEKNQSNPYLATKIHRLAKLKLGSSDLYLDEKQKANDLLLSGYKNWELLVKQSSDPLYTAVKLAVAGNVIDYGAHSVPDDINSQINILIKGKFKIDHTAELFRKIREAKSILYLGDNAGEVVFDKLFIETLQHPNVTYVVRGMPVINDVTFFDTEQVGFSGVCHVISNGYDAPSTILEYCSDEFLKLYHNADLIISKGQGNFEGLMNEQKENLYFLLMAKCEPMAKMLKVVKGDMIVTNLM